MYVQNKSEETSLVRDKLRYEVNRLREIKQRGTLLSYTGADIKLNTRSLDSRNEVRSAIIEKLKKREVEMHIRNSNIYICIYPIHDIYTYHIHVRIYILLTNILLQLMKKREDFIFKELDDNREQTIELGHINHQDTSSNTYEQDNKEEGSFDIDSMKDLIRKETQEEVAHSLEKLINTNGIFIVYLYMYAIFSIVFIYIYPICINTTMYK
jgi:hypothetical protein